MIEEEKKKIPGTGNKAFSKSIILCFNNLLLSMRCGGVMVSALMMGTSEFDAGGNLVID